MAGPSRVAVRLPLSLLRDGGTSAEMGSLIRSRFGERTGWGHVKLEVPVGVRRSDGTGRGTWGRICGGGDVRLPFPGDSSMVSLFLVLISFG